MTATQRSSRHRSREAALQVLYAIDLARARRPRPSPALAEEVFAEVAAHFDLPEGARAFAKELVIGVAGASESLDELIAAHATNWRVSRMGAVDRNVLRLATYELRTHDTPSEVVMDEAVELARRFGTERSPAFVNGVLDAIVRSVRSDSARSPST